MRESKIQYNPSLTVKENAKRNGVTEAAIRYYIKVNHLDRRFDRKQNIIDDCRKYLKKHPNTTKTELHKKTGHSLSTIYQYWEYITTEKEFSDFDSEKTQKRKLRQLNNFYATHPSCTSDILREEDFCKDILEPFCGVGTMSEVIKQNGHNVVSYDIVDRGYGQVGDFYHTEFPRRKYDIITNPPYDNIITLVLRCLEICKDKVALLMPLRYLSSSSRYNELYKKYPPARVYVYQERICIAKNADFKTYSDAGANLEIYAWYIWERGYRGATELRWISNDKKVSKEPVITPHAKELKRQLDELIEIEHANTLSLSQNPSYLSQPSKHDLRRNEKYDTSKHCCVAFRSKNDLWKDIPIPFGNMNGGYPYTMNGIEFPTSEHAYIFGIFSHNSPEHIALQRELLAEPSGYNAKRGIRNTHKSQWRTDWSDFNLDWMLYCVWNKAKECKVFRHLLMAIPQGTTIIEDVSFKPYEENGADFWGARNLEKKDFGKLAKKYAEALNLKTKKATEEIEDRLLWDYCNVGVYGGKNVMGKILMMIKECLHNGTEPDIDYELLKSKNIHFLGEPINFDAPKKKPQPIKALILDFDMTLFDTSADNEVRKGKKGKDIDWEEVYSLIPQYRLYDGWREVFTWAKESNVKIAIVSTAQGELIRRTLEHFNLSCDAVIGWNLYHKKPSGKLVDMAVEKMGVNKENVISIGDSIVDKQMSDNGGVQFYGALWDSKEMEEMSKSDCLSSPLDITNITI